MTSIAHIINPFRNTKRPDLESVQPLVCESMLKAKDFARHDVSVELYATVYPDDASAIPDGFTRTNDLKRSIVDVQPFENSKRLPLIYDILDNLFEKTSADYLIYTNMDIILMPHFYTVVHNYLQDGYNGLIINRREVEPTETNTLNTLAKIWSSIGEQGAGYDCFVFARKQYPSFHKDLSCIGVAAVDAGLAGNIMKYSSNFLFLPSEHITCHLGNDRKWTHEEYHELTRHNFLEFVKVWPHLEGNLLQRYSYQHHMIDRMHRTAERRFPTCLTDS